MTSRLLLFVEGDSEVEAAPVLVQRILESFDDATIWEKILLDRRPFRVTSAALRPEEKGGPPRVLRHLRAALKRPDLGAVLLLLDGDRGGADFCAVETSRRLCEEARKVGAGVGFSFAPIFALQEIESWVIAAVQSIQPDIEPPAHDLEESPRDAKGWLRTKLREGYKPTRHLTSHVAKIDLDQVRSRMRSFRRLESAIRCLVDALIAGKPVVSPGFESTARDDR